MTANGNKLRVLMVTPRYFPYMGGIETHVYEVGRRLVRNGVHVTLLTTAPREPLLPRNDEVEGMHVIRVSDRSPLPDYYIAPEISSIIKQGRWDLVHCQGCHTFVPPMAMLAARNAHLPYIVTFHTGGHSSNWRSKVRGIQWQLLRPLLAYATHLIGVSHFEANYFRDTLHLPVELFSVVPNGGVLPTLAQTGKSTPQQQLIISVGRLEKYKGHQHLIRALPHIRETYPDMKVRILGKGPYEAQLRVLAQQVGVAEHVDIYAIPSSDRQAMAEQLSQANLVTLLSEYEAHPIAVMEALTLRRPVLVADTPGLRELAEQGLVRSVSLKNTPKEIAQAVRQQLAQPITPSTEFTLPTWDDCTAKLQDIYTSSLRRLQCVF